MTIFINNTLVVSAPEFARRLGLSYETFRKRIYRGTLGAEPVERVGNHTFYAEGDVQRLVVLEGVK